MFIPAVMHDKTIGVLGLSRSGLASLDALVAAGGRVYAYDDKARPECPEGVEVVHYSDWPWHDMDMMVISPGIPHLHPEAHPAASLAREHEVTLISDIELMMLAEPQAKIIGITGTNGKSTIVSLIHHILSYNGISSALGGNIGTSILTLDDPGQDGVIILELSSYQLEITPSLSLDAGGVINITPDHLDRHGGWDGYVAAKAKLAHAVKEGGVLVLGDDPAAASLSSETSAKSVIIKGKDAPDLTTYPDLAGPHNAANTAFAMAIARFMGLNDDNIKATLPHFRGLPHRMEEVTVMDGIRFVNDSKATNGEAAAEALKSFHDIYWIAGGIAKEDGLGPALNVLDQVKHTYLIGASAEQFADQIGTSCPHDIVTTMDHAFRRAVEDASSDTRDPSNPATVLLSPAAASFDQFDSFEHRGDAFKELVTAMTQSQEGGRHV